MLKGHVFKQQVFGNQIFAVFFNTFLNGRNGVSNNYKNGMAITYNRNALTVQSGVVCIQGRFLEEDTSTDIATGTDTAYCKLIIEIDLDKQNTESEFVQGVYKIIKSASSYPNLTQTNIVKNNSGIYQYELARFRTSANGISDFKDMRTFLDFNSICEKMETDFAVFLEELKTKIANAEDGSAYILNNIQMKTIELSGNTQSGGNITGKLVLQKQGRIVTAYLEVNMNSAGTAVLSKAGENLKGYWCSASKTIKEPFIAIDTSGKGIQSATPSGVGEIEMYDDGDIEISVYSSKEYCSFYKTFSYMS